MKVLVTGGAGYIGTHTCIELLENGHEVIIVDNFSNSSFVAIKRVEEIVNTKINYYEEDLLNIDGIREIFKNEEIDAVIHFAAYKAVGESVSKPLEYYENNIVGTLNLCKVMQEFNVKNIIFSSSATVYGSPDFVPIPETASLSTTNPYGATKLMVEQILQDLYVADHEWNVVLLRYFNPIGAHQSGLIGEDPKGIPNNLIPYITQVAVGKLDKVSVFGNDYDTKDGTGVRDYIHVCDLASGHVAALKKLVPNSGVSIYNLGTGHGYSVIEMIEAFANASGKEISYRIRERRPGDIATCYADASKAKKEINWEAKYNLKDMCRDSWNWQSKNPNGYEQ